jgi:hypothetical protein
MEKEIALKVAKNNKVTTTHWFANSFQGKNIFKLFGLNRVQYTYNEIC